MDPRSRGGWLGGGAGGCGGKGLGVKCLSCVCGMSALEGGGWYPDVVTSVMGGGSGGRGGKGGLFRWDLRKSDSPVLVYRGHVNR